jgi:hypothetical protein
MIINGNKLPDFFVVGAAKSGTTTLYQILKNQPGIFCPEVKEPEHFTYKYLGNKYIIDGKLQNLVMLNYITDYNDYCNLFIEAKEDQLIGDFSTHSLFYSKIFIDNLKEVYGKRIYELKFIAILRHPVERAISHYTMKRRDFEEPLEITDAMNPTIIKSRLEKGYVKSFDYIGFSRYENQIKEFEKFNLNIKILKFTSFKNETHKFVSNIVEFLNCKSKDNSNVGLISNISGIPKNNVLNTIFKFLKKFSFIFKYIFTKKKYFEIKNKIFRKILLKPDYTSSDKEFINKLLHKEVEYYENL